MLSEDVIARLKEKVGGLRTVAAAADLQRLYAQNLLPTLTPAAFVIATGLQGGSVESQAGMYRQSTDEVISVLMVFRNAHGTAADTLDLLEPVKAAVIEALCGWGPEGVIGTFRLRSGRASTPSPGTLAYQIDFAIADQLRITPS